MLGESCGLSHGFKRRCLSIDFCHTMFMIVANAEREDPRQKSTNLVTASALKEQIHGSGTTLFAFVGTLLFTAARVRSTFISQGGQCRTLRMLQNRSQF